ncbi:MAG: DinB family protein [Thermomicrobiales bacterium]
MAESLAQPLDKADLLAKMQASYNELRAATAAVPPDNLDTVHDVGGWTVADHLAHVAAWERWKIALLRGTPLPDSLGVDRATYEADDTDAINAVIHAASAGVSPGVVMATSERTHADLMALISTFSDDDLRQPYSRFLPNAPGVDGDPTVLALCAYTIEHVAEHTELLRAMRPA